MAGELKHFLFENILLDDGWHQNVQLVIEGGDIFDIKFGALPFADGERVSGHAIPGMANLHSHAFQRAMAGLAEQVSPEGDFWGWRKIMYGFLEALTPEDVEAIAAQLYLEMLKGGYTSVGEFHYLHHQVGGNAYDNPAEMSARIMAAAETSGIALCHLPVLYQTADMRGGALAGPQMRFYNNTAAYQKLVEACQGLAAGNPNHSVGMAFHSLRAVPQSALVDCLADFPEIPVHIHVAEQPKEVEEALDVLRARPVRFLCDYMGLDARWCLVHATHMDADEYRDVAASGAIVGLCPTTEANLGDGFFDIERYTQENGRWGVGSDSHVSTSAAEELRLLDYGARLRTGKRVSGAATGHIGATMWQKAAQDGHAALGFDAGSLWIDKHADIVVLDAGHPVIAGRDGDAVLDSLVFAGHGNPVRDVMVGGEWRIRDGRHIQEEMITERFINTIKKISSSN